MIDEIIMVTQNDFRIRPEGLDWLPVAGHVKFSRRAFRDINNSYLEESKRTGIYLWYQGLSYAGTFAVGIIYTTEAIQRIL